MILTLKKYCLDRQDFLIPKTLQQRGENKGQILWVLLFCQYRQLSFNTRPLRPILFIGDLCFFYVPSFRLSTT